MKYTHNSATVLIYTLVLVVLSVFMASAVLNLTTQLNVDQQLSILNEEWSFDLRKDAEYMLYEDAALNNNGGWFVDVIWCPDNFTMSGTTFISTWLSSTLRYIWWEILCRSTHNGNDIDIFFNSGFDDIASAEYEGSSVSVNSWSTTATFWDSDATLIDLNSSFPLIADGIDDNFNDDDHTPESDGWSGVYPDDYRDDDADMRIQKFGYILPNETDHNIYWINSNLRRSISNDPYNIGTKVLDISNISDGRIILDVDQSHKITIYELDKDAHEDFGEVRIKNTYIGWSESSGSWYLQTDLSVSTFSTWSDFVFDFTSSDYALMLDNESSDIMSYIFTIQDDLTSKPVYINSLSSISPSYYNGTRLVRSESGFASLSDTIYGASGSSISSPPLVATLNTVEFETDDKVIGIDTTGYDNSGLHISLTWFTPLAWSNSFVVGIGFDTYVAFLSTERLRARAEATDGTVIFNDTTGIGSITFWETYNIDYILTDTSYDLLLDGVSISSWTYTSVWWFKLPNNINATSAASSLNSWNFYVEEIIYRDGTGSVIFSENGNAASWNTKITHWSVDDVWGSWDVTSPILAQVTPVSTPDTDSTPSYTFSSDEAGSISYGGSCSSATTSASTWNNTIIFSSLADGAYTDCTVTVTDGSANASSVLAVNSFTIDTTAPTIPSSLTEDTVTSSSIDISFWASTDSLTWLDFYSIYRDWVVAWTWTSLSYTDTWLSASTAYSYTVSATDIVWNESSQSSALVSTTSAASWWTNIVQFEQWDEIDGITITGFDTTWFTIEVDDFYTDRTDTVYILHTTTNTYIRVDASGIIRLIVREPDNTLARSVLLSSWDALLANTYYDLEVVVTATSYDIIVDGVSKSSWTISWATNLKLPEDINNRATAPDFRMSRLTYKDGAWVTIFEETWNAASWNARLTSWSVTDVP